MASVFLSYSRDDIDRIRPLAIALEKAGHDVWWDRHIVGGEEYAGAIEQALESARAVVVAWTATSVKSAWVRDEAGQGRDTERLIPLTLDGCSPPLGFRQYQTIDLSRWNGRAGSHALDPLFDAIEKIGARAAPSKIIEQPADVPSKRGVSRKVAIVSGSIAILLVAVGIVYPRVATGGPISPKIALGAFALTSSDLPKELPAQISQEVMAAFGAENAVAVEGPGSGKMAPFVMAGSVAQEGPTLRYTVDLTDSRSGVVLWSKGYDRDRSDVLAPRQVAVEASQVVRCGLWGAASYKHRMTDGGLSLYLKWCDEHWSGSADDTAELDAARAVTAAIPDFSFGWSALALAAVPLAQDPRSPDARQLSSEARAAAQRSISLDDQNPEGYMALAGLLPLSQYEEREKLLKKALSVRRLECGCEPLSYGDFLVSVGRTNEAVEQYQRGTAKMPLAPFSNVRLAQALYEVGRQEEADRVLSDTLKIWPDASDLQLLKIKAAFWNKRYPEALAALHSPELHLGRDQRDALIATFEALGDRHGKSRTQAIGLLKQCAADPEKTDRLIVAALAAVGDQQSALAAARQLIDVRGHRYTDVLFEPNLASAKQSQGYSALVSDLGLSSYWRQEGHQPDICSGNSSAVICGSRLKGR